MPENKCGPRNPFVVPMNGYNNLDALEDAVRNPPVYDQASVQSYEFYLTNLSAKRFRQWTTSATSSNWGGCSYAEVSLYKWIALDGTYVRSWREVGSDEDQSEQISPNDAWEAMELEMNTKFTDSRSFVLFSNPGIDDVANTTYLATLKGEPTPSSQRSTTPSSTEFIVYALVFLAIASFGGFLQLRFLRPQTTELSTPLKFTVWTIMSLAVLILAYGITYGIYYSITY